MRRYSEITDDSLVQELQQFNQVRSRTVDRSAVFASAGVRHFEQRFEVWEIVANLSKLEAQSVHT